MTTDPAILAWLLDSDPALRWQVERDLAGADADTWQETRRRVATEGFGAALLAQQGQDGQWEGGAFFPANFFGSPEAEMPGQPWTATTWVLKDLREWGAPASALEGTAQQLDRHSRWEYEDMPYWGGEVDVCINSYTLAAGAWLDADVSRLVRWFPEHQLADGGWNCEAEEGDSMRGSFHSTLGAVRGMLAWERSTGDTRLRASRHRGEGYLLERRLLYRLSTGEPVAPFVREFVFPNRYRYSALAALDHFRDVSLLEGAAPDERLADAVGLVRERRQADGTWHQDRRLEGRRWFEIDAPEGQPSRWLTFLALRVLAWWDAAR
ncbi:squalene cyclase [Microbacterium sp. EYE_5]|uniref:squalene cyclase n=1 Tax=unclassified Microbacterium TaxID=2609290 RepID=UPI0020066FC5|nr:MULTISPECIES: squalene cyclase [unclassified Microbacterium]MCK6081616.1 squalene cyclase [Microbacterium sp. EYE_382]MCK6086886.1 squalene cyclase [Microbacterium sp. EYE_384]MCK6123616.1 squalene cyclase [Microbacterium sp. EYE_80]MCK6126525.1 squalene cyclase [Microbacterium sp. EYE_79]MCK6142570.1 squalene cyclase [Microbacterium sp. EYE_39]